MSPSGRVLVVDDDHRVRELVSDYLADEGYSVTQAIDGEEALAAVDRDRPDLVLLDIGLPGIDALEVLDRILRAEPAISVILLSENDQVARARAGIQIGAIDCLFKPSGLGRLGNSVARGIARLEEREVSPFS